MTHRDLAVQDSSCVFYARISTSPCPHMVPIWCSSPSFRCAVEPEDVVLVKNALKAMGVTEYEPGVLQLLLNYMYRCVL